MDNHFHFAMVGDARAGLLPRARCRRHRRLHAAYSGITASEVARIRSPGRVFGGSTASEVSHRSPWPRDGGDGTASLGRGHRSPGRVVIPRAR